MEGKFGILMVIAALYPLGLGAKGIFGVNEQTRLVQQAIAEAEKPFAASVSYAVSLPSADNDVVYTVELASEKALEADRLCPVDYLIDWTLPRQEGVSQGFLSYFNGHLYRYRDHRLQEYHFDWDSIPFLAPTGRVQTSGQFVDLLPAFLWKQVGEMIADSTFSVRMYPDTTVAGVKSCVVKAVQNVRGFDGRYFTLIADPATLLPRKIDNEFNPGQVSEQLVTATYDYSPTAPLRAVRSEEALIAAYPEVFAKYRESNYAIQNLKGLPLPQFALPTITGERYAHHRYEHFASPTLVALIDPSVSTAEQTVKDLRKAVAMSPVGVDLVMAFRSNSIDEVEQITGPAQMGEYILLGAQSLARDTGTTVFPTIILADTDGNVADVILGFNNSLASDVIQGVAMIRE